MRRLLAPSAALFALATGCVIVDPSCGGSGGTTILISPSVIFVAVGQSATPHASWCRHGRYDDLSPEWSVASAADANVIALDPVTGRITGKRPGTATVIARYGGVEGASVRVTVQ